MRILSIYAKQTTFFSHWNASRISNLIIHKQPWVRQYETLSIAIKLLVICKQMQSILICNKNSNAIKFLAISNNWNQYLYAIKIQLQSKLNCNKYLLANKINWNLYSIAINSYLLSKLNCNKYLFAILSLWQTKEINAKPMN